MIKFTFIFLLLYWLGINSKNEKAVNKYNTVMTVLFIIMMGLRNEVTYGDTYGYFVNFEDFGGMSVREIIDRWPKDTFYYICGHFLHPVVSHNYTLWLFLIALLYMIPLSMIVKRYSVNPMFSWLCFIFIGLMMFVMAGLRQTIAFGFMMIAFLKLLDGKKKYFFLFIAIAYLFHATSLICLLIYPLSKLRFNRRMLLWYVAAFGVLVVMGATVLQGITSYLGENDARYISYGENLHGSNYTYMIQQAMLILPSFYFLRNRFNEPLVAFFSHLSMVAFIFVSMSPIIAEMFRVSMYFSWANMILFPMAMTEASKKKSLLPSFFIVFFILYLVFVNKTAWTDYYFWFEDATHLLMWH